MTTEKSLIDSALRGWKFNLERAEKLFGGLSPEQLEQHHWKVAIKLLDTALKEPRYLYAANVTLQTALILDGLLEAGKV